ncbi:SOS response-associated peptidase [Paenibacillus sp. GCM10012307]|uniref:Abasic site processing protein n=1 Tax=Paenibacillus roseus TaxID=2798579 RepID=A0A934IYI4_9BACL|nr:SOS response-associated peptidase [Paenibacillus roseus]MBJ6361577.1 SOS response-associated peptidase [Paenibacillus roseus]
MCDRFSLHARPEELQEKYQVQQMEAVFRPRYNIAPTQSIPIIVQREGQRQLVEARWGLFPFWAKDSINADFGSVSNKKIFERIIKRQRCLIPSSGFYGWRTEGKEKQAFHIVMKDQKVFAMAGLYETRMDPRGQLQRSCTIITAMANTIVSSYHNRMPAIMDEEEQERWLDPHMTDRYMLENHIYAYPASAMYAYPVKPLSGDEEIEESELMEEIGPSLWLVKE